VRLCGQIPDWLTPHFFAQETRLAASCLARRFTLRTQTFDGA